MWTTINIFCLHAVVLHSSCCCLCCVVSFWTCPVDHAFRKMFCKTKKMYCHWCPESSWIENDVVNTSLWCSIWRRKHFTWTLTKTSAKPVKPSSAGTDRLNIEIEMYEGKNVIATCTYKAIGSNANDFTDSLNYLILRVTTKL